jgi:hypothetical protein
MRVVVILLALILAEIAPALANGKKDTLSISAARMKLISQGWKPLETFGSDVDGTRWSLQGNAGAMHSAGFIEVESCSGTGLNYCSFNYVRAGKCLNLHTQGEFKVGAYEPHVIKRINKCPLPEDRK